MSDDDNDQCDDPIVVTWTDDDGGTFTCPWCDMSSAEREADGCCYPTPPDAARRTSE